MRARTLASHHGFLWMGSASSCARGTSHGTYSNFCFFAPIACPRQYELILLESRTFANFRSTESNVRNAVRAPPGWVVGECVLGFLLSYCLLPFLSRLPSLSWYACEQFQGATCNCPLIPRHFWVLTHYATNFSVLTWPNNSTSNKLFVSPLCNLSSWFLSVPYFCRAPCQP